MIAYEFTDEQGCAIAATALAFGVTFREMAAHVLWFKEQCRIGRVWHDGETP
jgi:hypothetical protein